MADLKLNQLGLHFSDDQGFRIESTSHPEVVSRDHLSKREVQRIVALATKLHITVVPEIDSPGHLGAVIAAHPDLQLRDKDGKPVKGAVDIANPEAARIVDDLLREYAELFPGAYWHLGGDEYQALMVKAPATPETTFPGLAAAARDKYGPKATIKDLATGWLNDRAAVLRSASAGPHLQGVERRLLPRRRGRRRPGPRGGVLDGQGARGPPARGLPRRGAPVVNLNDEYLYYVLGEPNNFKYPTGKRIYEEWTPLVVRGTKPVAAKYAGQILGGRFAVWGGHPGAQTEEQVARGIRMPLRATAQKLWDTADRRPWTGRSSSPWRTDWAEAAGTGAGARRTTGAAMPRRGFSSGRFGGPAIERWDRRTAGAATPHRRGPGRLPSGPLWRPRTSFSAVRAFSVTPRCVSGLLQLVQAMDLWGTEAVACCFAFGERGRDDQR